LGDCPKRAAPYDVNRDGSKHSDRTATPPPAPKKEEKKVEEKKAEKKEEALVQKNKKDNFWTPSCEWHLNEDGSDCVTKFAKCTETDSPKPSLENCPHRHSPYDINKDGSTHTDRTSTPPPPPPPEPVKEEKKDAKAEAKAEAKAALA
jgi:hypothetical protein